MKKSVLHIELVDRPLARSGNAEDNANGGRFDNQTEHLALIDPKLLRETANNPSCLVTSECTKRMKFMLKDPLACDHIGTSGARNQLPCAIINQ